jgi:hypothetical protein
VAKIHHFAIYKKSQATLLMELIGKNPQKSPNFEEESMVGCVFG